MVEKERRKDIEKERGDGGAEERWEREKKEGERVERRSRVKGGWTDEGEERWMWMETAVKEGQRDRDGGNKSMEEGKWCMECGPL